MKLLKSEHNPVSGVTTQYWLHTDGKITVRGIQDAEPIIKNNREELNRRSAKSTKLNEADGLGTKVASIPMGLIDELKVHHNFDILRCSEAELKKFLNSSEYAKLRTSHGRI